MTKINSPMTKFHQSFPTSRIKFRALQTLIQDHRKPQGCLAMHKLGKAGINLDRSRRTSAQVCHTDIGSIGVQ
jgi:hypothetical protein